MLLLRCCAGQARHFPEGSELRNVMRHTCHNIYAVVFDKSRLMLLRCCAGQARRFPEGSESRLLLQT
jgi:hypothetical protein